MSPTKPAPLTIITSVAQLLSSAAPTGSAMAGSEDGQPSTPNMDHAKQAPLSPLAVSPVSIQRQPSRTDSDDDAALLDKFMARYAFLNY
ncbi:hypothetical protein BC831DRAFT_84304 [Entophlyctis helioformis]|nr:hypothetical protein BC831DRAFT_84304 [Entophlyctis helioformis]